MRQEIRKGYYLAQVRTVASTASEQLRGTTISKPATEEREIPWFHETSHVARAEQGIVQMRISENVPLRDSF